MSFTSIEFLLFIALLAALYRATPLHWRYFFLLAASYLFYLSAGLKSLGLLIAVTMLTFVAGIVIGRASSQVKKIVFLATLFSLCSYLFVFKMVAVLPRKDFASWVMPLGLSYYTFKLIGYVLDVYWGKIKPENRIVAFASYVAFFPQIVAGPIQRADYFQQKPVPGLVSPAVLRIAWGIAKKLIVADNLAPAVTYIFSHVAGSHTPLWIGFYLWPLQLYADFSGLTDIAIGTGLLFGITGPREFQSPVYCIEHQRLLAPLAHVSHQLAGRLPIHSVANGHS